MPGDVGDAPSRSLPLGRRAGNRCSDATPVRDDVDHRILLTRAVVWRVGARDLEFSPRSGNFFRGQSPQVASM